MSDTETRLIGDWDSTLKLEAGDAIHSSVSAEDGAFACTDSELLYANASGVQRAQLAQIAKVNRENADIVISSADGVLIRGPVSADQASLVAFFDAVKTATSKAKVVKPPSPVSSSPINSSPVIPSVPASSPSDSTPTSSFAMNTPANSTHSTFTPATSSFPEAKVTSSVSAPVAPNPQAAGRPAARMSPVAGAVGPDRLPLEYAGFWVRTVAFIIDSVVIYVAQSLLQVALGLQNPTSLEEMRQFSNLDSRVVTGWVLFTVLAVLWQWLYYAFMESSSRQGTLGKMAMGLAVTDLEGRKLSFARASGRFLAKGLANVLAGVVIVIGVVVLSTDSGPAGADPNIMFTQRAVMGFLWTMLLGVLIVLASNIMAAFTKRKQALQDIVSGCVVLRKPSS
jgi:uncharacterized RDD family membrane protein YckC